MIRIIQASHGACICHGDTKWLFVLVLLSVGLRTHTTVDNSRQNLVTINSYSFKCLHVGGTANFRFEMISADRPLNSPCLSKTKCQRGV